MTFDDIDADRVIAEDFKVLAGDAREQLRKIPDGTVHCMVTSPPFWGLRSYGDDEVETVWQGEDDCDHVWGPDLQGKRKDLKPEEERENTARLGTDEASGTAAAQGGNYCQKCGGWRGQLGLEPSPQQYVRNIREIFRGVHRVLREDGIAWLNIGDSYAGGGGIRGVPDDWDSISINDTDRHKYAEEKPNRDVEGLKDKDLVGIPWRVAFALQDDGWWLRSDVIWAKGISGKERMGSCMPESVTDRPISAHEHIFLLAKSKHYHYDHIAVREELNSSVEEIKRAGESVRENHRYGEVAGRPLGDASFRDPPSGGNPRDVLYLSTASYDEAHFAVFDESLPRFCIRAGTSTYGACVECGAPWERMVDNQRDEEWSEENIPDDEDVPGPAETSFNQETGTLHRDGGGVYGNHKTVGWEQTCDCETEKVQPCVVLDPFAGSGTTAIVAMQEGQKAVGIDVQPKYLDLMEDRILQQDGTETARDNSVEEFL